jgi:RNA polymerase sigma-70 factor, ECF subfamily
MPASQLANSIRLSDVELMAKISTGSVESFVELYDRYYERAFRVARGICHDTDRAQEAVQDGFMSVWNSRATYCPEHGSVAAWLLTVVRYRAIDVARSNGRHASRRADEAQVPMRAVADDPLEIAVKHDDARRLHASLALLPDSQAEVIALAYYGELTHTEIAAHLGLPAGTVKGRMRLALQKLQANIEQAAA